MSFSFGSRSLSNLNGVHIALQKVALKALDLTVIDFVITDGVRTPFEQELMVKQGKSTTKNSRHLTGHAIDVAAWVNGKVSWDPAYYALIAKAFKQASRELNVPIIWGGDWETFKDSVHFELNRNFYPA